MYDLSSWLDEVVIVLAVDDDPSLLTLVDRLLTARGHIVLIALDPDDATVVITERGMEPDLLLVDLVLASRSGLEYALAMKSSRPTLKIVFMTEWPHLVPSALRSGLGPVIHKPFTADQLYSAIEKA